MYAFECHAMCGGAAACISSPEEESFIIDTVVAQTLGYTSYARLWIGQFFDERTNEWMCASTDEVASYSRFGVGQMVGGSTTIGWPRLCGWISGLGWSTSQCHGHPRQCVCASSGTVSAETQSVLDAIDARTSAYLRSRFLILLLVAVLIGLIPSYYMCLSSWGSKIRSRRSKRSAIYVEPKDAAAVNNTEDEQARVLEASKRAAANLRLRVSFVLRQTGFLFFALAMIFWLGAGAFLTVDLLPIAGPGNAYIVLAGPAGALMLLSVLPTDAAVIRVLCCFFFGSTMFLFLFNAFAVLSLLLMSGAADVPLFGWLGFVFIGLISLASGAFLSPAIQCSCACKDRAWSPRGSLRRLWLVYRVWTGGLGLASMIGPLGGLLMTPDFLTRFVSSGFAVLLYACSFLFFAIILTPANRGRFLRWLGSLGKSGSKEQEAASVAALLGKTSAADALAQAQSRFRGLPLLALTVEEMAHNKPDPEMHAKTVSARLGEVNAFASHSWSDGGNAKFERLHEWATDLGLDPAKTLLWLDKACIDQMNIDASLMALPVFLAGAKQLLVLAGPTYSTRLWYAISTTEPLNKAADTLIVSVG